MPIGIYKRPIGFRPKSIFKKGYTPWNKGIPRTREEKRKISIGNTGKIRSIETKIRMSIASLSNPQTFRKGHIPWSKGKTGVYSQEVLQKRSEFGKKNPINYWLGKKHPIIGKCGNISKTKEYQKFHRIKRRKLLLGLSIQTIQQVYEDNIKKYKTLTCYLCLKPILFGDDHLEHKIPLSRGGDSKKNNLAVSCKKCNQKKHTKTETEYRKELLCL